MVKSSFTFSLFTEIAFSFKALRASPLEAKKFVLAAKAPIISKPSSTSETATLACGTPSKTSKNVCSSKDFKSEAVDFPNKILEACIAFS